jgi:hypothetical protein
MILVVSLRTTAQGQPLLDGVFSNNDPEGGVQVFVRQEFDPPVRFNVNTSLQDWREAISGVEVFTVPAKDTLDWRLNNQTLNELLIAEAINTATDLGILNQNNVDLATIHVVFSSQDNRYHCYLEFHE